MQRKEKCAIAFKGSDSFGNKLIYEEDTSNIFLVTPVHRKMIGTILEENDTLIYYKVEDEEQIHRNTRSWTIPRIILKEVDKVRYETSKAVYEISHKDAFADGFTSSFDELTIDKKIYVPITYWSIVWKDVATQRRINMVGYEWYFELKAEFEKAYFKSLNDFLKTAYASGPVYPASKDIFKAFRLAPFRDVNVVIVGEAPYAEPWYDGLAFSAPGNIVPKATEAILKGIETDIHGGFLLVPNTNFEYLAKQGVLLLNRVLTASKSGAHVEKGWEILIAEVINRLSTKKENVVFMLLGEYSWDTRELIKNKEHHLVFNTSLYNSVDFCKENWFSTTNSYLEKHHKRPIAW
jgi:uracil-DNA glycosylase